ncbi:hypothetical protein KKP06_23940 [Ralstonia pickettii]|jgi:hypothetical protein|nr:hypothetical protein [Ralstonia pickettii]MBT2180861.1 hypothetical protein [Ralstonia pickettii]
MNMNEAYEAAGRAKEILNIEHAIDIGQIKSIDDVRAALRSSSAEIAENLNAHGFEGWVNGVPIFKNGHELNATMAMVTREGATSLRDQDREALRLAAEVLVRIRWLARGQRSGHAAATTLKVIHDLADAVHNTPRLIADSVLLPNLLEHEMNEAKALLSRSHSDEGECFRG